MPEGGIMRYGCIPWGSASLGVWHPQEIMEEALSPPRVPETLQHITSSQGWVPRGQSPDGKICLWHWPVLSWTQKYRNNFWKGTVKTKKHRKGNGMYRSSKAFPPVSAQALIRGRPLGNSQHLSGPFIPHLLNGITRPSCSQVCPEPQIRRCVHAKIPRKLQHHNRLAHFAITSQVRNVWPKEIKWPTCLWS